MAELVYALVLGTSPARVRSSSLLSSTVFINIPASLAQLVEQLPLKETVGGSIPSRGTIEKLAFLFAL